MANYNDNTRVEAFKHAVWTLAEWLVEEYQRTQLARATTPSRSILGIKPKDGAQKLLNVNELSKYLSVPKGTIYTDVCLRKIPAAAIVKLGKSLRFDKDAIDQWIEERRNKN